MAKKGGAGGIIVVAVVLGAATAFLIWKYEKDRDERSEANWREVVVAQQDIKARTKITRELLKIEKFPKSLLAEENPIANPAQVEGRLAARDIRAKDQIRNVDLLAAGVLLDLSYKVPDGMRAIAIGAGEVPAVGTAIQPGNRVDILVTYNDPVVRQQITKILLQNVLVLAVNRGQTEPGGGGKEGGPGGASSSMTLAVKPEDTELVAAADRAGALKVSLRGTKDTAIVPTSGITARDFSTIVPPEPVVVTQQTVQVRATPVALMPPVKAKTTVTIIHGTKSQVVEP